MIHTLYPDFFSMFKNYSLPFFFLYTMIFIIISSCSTLIPSPEGSANNTYRVHFTNSNWRAIGPDSSDYAFISSKTKSTIIAQSFCKKYHSTSLELMSSTILNGIDDLKTIERKEILLSEREGLRTLAQGAIDGVPIFLNLVSVNKDLCLFDFALISTSAENLKNDEKSFEEFLKGLSL